MSMPPPADELGLILLDFERDHPGHSGAKEELIRSELRMTPARFYQLLARFIWTDTAVRADPILVHRLRRRSEDEHAERVAFANRP
jgi:hypothetical protein